MENSPTICQKSVWRPRRLRVFLSGTYSSGHPHVCFPYNLREVFGGPVPSRIIQTTTQPNDEALTRCRDQLSFTKSRNSLFHSETGKCQSLSSYRENCACHHRDERSIKQYRCIQHRKACSVIQGKITKRDKY